MYYGIFALVFTNLIWLAFSAIYFIKYKNLKSKFRREPSYECQQLLADILNGSAIVKIERLPSENLFLRRR